MRLPYVPNPVPTTTPEDAAIVARIEARRAPRLLIPLDLALLHSPPVADGWNSFIGAIRTQTSIAPDLRELAICCVAAVNDAEFEWMHHAPLAIEAGVNEGALEEMKRSKGGVSTGLLDEKQKAVVDYAVVMTKNVRVPDDLFERIKGLFTNREVVEITATIAAYNCVSRFLVALDVGEKNT